MVQKTPFWGEKIVWISKTSLTIFFSKLTPFYGECRHKFLTKGWAFWAPKSLFWKKHLFHFYAGRAKSSRMSFAVTFCHFGPIPAFFHCFVHFAMSSKFKEPTKLVNFECAFVLWREISLFGRGKSHLLMWGNWLSRSLQDWVHAGSSPVASTLFYFVIFFNLGFAKKWTRKPFFTVNFVWSNFLNFLWAFFFFPQKICISISTNLYFCVFFFFFFDGASRL